jgi:hypothetical protein
MNRKPYLYLLLMAALLAAPAHGAEPRKEDAGFSAKLLGAVANDDYADFVADGTTEFQGLTKDKFDAVSAQLAPKFKAAHTVTFLGELNQHGFRVTLWKISFADGGDDALATLSVKDGKVGGFWIR